MKSLLRTCAILAVAAATAGSQAVTETSGDPAVVGSIQSAITSIDRDTTRFRRTQHTLIDYSAEGGTLVGFYDRVSLRKLSAHLTGESGTLTQHLYFSAGQLVFVHSVYDQHETKSRVEHRVYLNADRPIRRIRTQSEARPTEAVASWDPLPELLGRVNGFIACAASPEASCTAAIGHTGGNSIVGFTATRIPAQQPAPSANPITQSFRGFGFYGNWLKAAFDSIPAARYDFKPTPVQQSVGYIAQHLEDANYQLCAIIGGTQRTVTAKDSLADTIKAKWPKDTLVARLWTSLLFCQEAFTRLNDARLAEDVTVGPPGATRTFARARYVMLFITDLAEHYAQIAAYMRLLGMIPPSALPRPTGG